MEKIQIRKSTFGGPVQIPSNIKEYLKDRPDEMTAAVRKVNGWLKKLIGRGVVGGTAIGKHYATLVLDVSYQSSSIYISENGNIKLHSDPVEDFKQFKEKFLERYEVVTN